MQALDKPLRRALEAAVVKARDIAEAAAREDLQRLTVGDAVAGSYLNVEQRKLRNRLRAHGRQLGDIRKADATQSIEHLVAEVAYEQWHRMLFARFLAENNLLMYEDGVTALSLQDCFDLAKDEGGEGWEYTARYAAKMLPQIFRPDSPAFELTFAPNHQHALEKLLMNLGAQTFQASDALGWVYQFWQSKKKEQVNASEVKIGADELPAVTQIFTEPYMVSFLLDNSLGAWWAARRLSEMDLQTASSEEELRRKASIPGVPLDYLRFIKPPSPTGRGDGGEGENRDEGKEVKHTPVPADILENARNLRQQQTDAEQLLWSLLRNRHFADKKIRRQHPEGRYILDFYCHELKLAIELDGGQHNEATAKRYDEARSRYLEEQGIRVIRFWNNEVLQQTESVLESLWHSLTALTPTPLPEGEGLCWQPAAGTFDTWPEHLSELNTLDPCCGSGHFLVAAFLMLVPMRMELEGMSARDAVDAVLRDNLHGLELDQRCVELAAFALAMTAWKYPCAGGYRPLPALNLACSGLSISVAKEEWKRLGFGKKNLSIALDWMHDIFNDAPVLGSLLNPAKSDAAQLVPWNELSASIEQALAQEQTDEQQEVAVIAQGLSKAATLLAGQYQWVITNVPYLSRGKQHEVLRDYCEKHYPAGKNDLATAFLDRCLELCSLPSPLGRGVGGEGGTVSVVLPQNWLFLTSYKKFREKLLRNDTWHLIVRLGAGAFETISGEVVKAVLISISRGNASHSSLMGNDSPAGIIRGVDVSEPRTAAEKAQLLKGSPLPPGEGLGVRAAEIKSVAQAKQLDNPDARVALEEAEDLSLLNQYADSLVGLQTSDDPMFLSAFWEAGARNSDIWELMQATPDTFKEYAGQSWMVRWEKGEGLLLSLPTAYPTKGLKALGKSGIAVHRMGQLFPYHYGKERFHQNVATIIPNDEFHLPAIWCFCSSPEYNQAVRRIDQKLNVTNATLVKVPFDLERWQKVAEEKYPNGLPQPYSDDPTQWIFHGHPCGSVIWDDDKKWTAHGTLRTDNTVLHTAVARLLGYRWPAELDEGMELADEQREWVKRSQAFSLTPTPLPAGEGLDDDDGIVCLSAVRGEKAAAERLEAMLQASFGSVWSTNVRNKLLEAVGCQHKSLDFWLWEKFFEQHCKLFQHRPFIWHIWDGLKDGFSVLVNYHQLDKQGLERLIYTYLDDWIRTQTHQQAEAIDGADIRLQAAQGLKQRLQQILKGEAPYDIFVRWKPLEQQPVGWNPDINDGVRLNIRPFMTVDDVGRRGAGILRFKPNIHWKKDRGKDVASAPWYKLGLEYEGREGDRINDHHLSLLAKQAGTEKK